MPESAVPAGQGPDPLQVMRSVVAEALDLIPRADGAVVELVSEEVLTYVCGAGALAGTEGTQVTANGSLSGRSVEAGRPLHCADTETDPRVDRDTYRRLKIRSMIVLPLPYRGKVAGVLKLSSTQPESFTDDDVQLLGGLAVFIGEAIGGWAELAESASQVIDALPADGSSGTSGQDSKVSMFLRHVLNPAARQDAAARERVERTIAGRELTMVLQPIVSLKTGNPAGFEALARFQEDPERPPDQWFADAHRVGLRTELELLALELAFERMPLLPSGSYLAVNASHEMICDSRFVDLLATVDATRVVVELTEHLEITDYPTLNAAITELRSRGARLAIDDTGAGFAGFSHILRLSPDLLKLDRILTTGIDADPARQALAGALVNFAFATRAKVVAEGIETEAELQAIHRLGVDFGQGYFFSRPRYEVVVPDPLPVLAGDPDGEIGGRTFRRE